MMLWFALAVAGGVGAASRYALDVLVTARIRSKAPWGTWVVNVTGSLLAGLVVGSVAAGGLPPDVGWVLVGGFLGAYTTFSTAMVQVVQQAHAGLPRHAVVNLLGSAVTCVLAAACGLALAA